MRIISLDHLVLTVADIHRSCTFYESVLGMEIVTFGNGRKALKFGHQKINLHQKDKEINPIASFPTAGSADLCFIAETPLPLVVQELEAHGVSILEGGIVSRTGAEGPIDSVYFRDPDGNLIEVSNYPEEEE